MRKTRLRSCGTFNRTDGRLAEIIDLAAHRKQLEKKPTLEELAVTCAEEISENWQRFAKNNRLNDYFRQSAPSFTKDDLNYLQDLNAISSIELRLNLTMTLNAPQSIDSSQLGWIAHFKIGNAFVSTPFMPFETYARCFNILLFLKLSRELTTRGITVS